MKFDSKIAKAVAAAGTAAAIAGFPMVGIAEEAPADDNNEATITETALVVQEGEEDDYEDDSEDEGADDEEDSDEDSDGEDSDEDSDEEDEDADEWTTNEYDVYTADDFADAWVDSNNYNEVTLNVWDDITLDTTYEVGTDGWINLLLNGNILTFDIENQDEAAIVNYGVLYVEDGIIESEDSTYAVIQNGWSTEDDYEDYDYDDYAYLNLDEVDVYGGWNSVNNLMNAEAELYNVGAYEAKNAALLNYDIMNVYGGSYSSYGDEGRNAIVQNFARGDDENYSAGYILITAGAFAGYDDTDVPVFGGDDTGLIEVVPDYYRAVVLGNENTTNLLGKYARENWTFDNLRLGVGTEFANWTLVDQAWDYIDPANTVDANGVVVPKETKKDAGTKASSSSTSTLPQAGDTAGLGAFVALAGAGAALAGASLLRKRNER